MQPATRCSLRRAGKLLWQHVVLRLSQSLSEPERQVPKRRDYRILLVHWKILTTFSFPPFTWKTVPQNRCYYYDFLFFFFQIYLQPLSEILGYDVWDFRTEWFMNVTRNQIMKFVFGLTTRQRAWRNKPHIVLLVFSFDQMSWFWILEILG